VYISVANNVRQENRRQLNIGTKIEIT